MARENTRQKLQEFVCKEYHFDKKSMSTLYPIVTHTHRLHTTTANVPFVATHPREHRSMYNIQQQQLQTYRLNSYILMQTLSLSVFEESQRNTLRRLDKRHYNNNNKGYIFPGLFSVFEDFSIRSFFAFCFSCLQKCLLCIWVSLAYPRCLSAHPYTISIEMQLITPTM